MDKEKFKEIMKKCFGKEKDTRWHAIAMLVIYFVFIVFVAVFIRLMPQNPETTTTTNNNNPTSTPTSKTNTGAKNYAYTYTVNFDNDTEVYIGKRYGSKYKFSLIKSSDSSMNGEYAKIYDNYYVLENDTYKTTKLEIFFKYCDIDKIMNALEYSDEESENVYDVENDDLADEFKDYLVTDNREFNIVSLDITDDVVKGVNMNLSNYISSVLGSEHQLKITMNFTDIGTTENFTIETE